MAGESRVELVDEESEYVFSANGETVKKTVETQTVVGEDGVAKTKTVETITHPDGREEKTEHEELGAARAR